MASEALISWAVLADRHQRGSTKFGPVWIRTDRSGSVTGVYACFGKTRKQVPKDGESWTPEEGRTVAELMVEEEVRFRELVASVMV